MRGRLIVIEGLDGTGKSTLASRLALALGAAHRTTPGEQIRSVRGAFDAAFEVCPVSRSLAYGASVVAEGRRAQALLRAGQDVVMDRYWLSTLAYAPPEARSALRAMGDLVVPADLTLLLTLPEERRRARLLGRGALSDADALTLGPGQGHWLLERYRSYAGQPAAGDLLELSAEGDAQAVLTRALELLERWGLPQLPLFEATG